MKFKTISVELLNVCNFKCVHCYVVNAEEKNKKMKFDTFKRIVEYAKELGVVRVILTGGEAIIHEHFRDYYCFLINEGFLVNIYTNGTMISNFYYLLSQNKPEKIEISVYGMSHKSYEKVTKSASSYDKVFQNIERLLNMGIDISLKYIVLKQNYNEVDLFVNYCEENNIREYNIIPALFPLINKEKEVDTSYRIESADIVNLCEVNGLKVIGKDEFVTCDAGDYLHFTPDGKVKGCPVLSEEYACEDFSNKSIVNIVKSIKLENSGFKYCPAWEKIEGHYEIKEYLGGEDETV